MRIVASLAVSVLTCTAALSQSVLVQGAGGVSGQGYMVTSGGACYLLLPAHVAGEFPFVDVLTQAPVRVGQALVSRPFWTVSDPDSGRVRGIDLAIGVVRGAAAEACETPLDRFRPAERLADRSGDLVTILAGGQVERVRMAITETRYLEFDAEIRSPGAEMYPGRSGSFLFIDTAPAGMAVRAAESDPTQASFVRIEEILMNARRWIADQGAQFVQGATPEATAQPAGFAVRLAETSEPPIGPEYPAEATLTGEGAFVANPTRPLRIVYAVDGAAAASLSRVVVSADPEANYALPRNIVIEVDSTPGQTRPRLFWSGQMAPDGLADTGPKTGTTTRWIIVTIRDAWRPGPVGVSQIRFE